MRSSRAASPWLVILGPLIGIVSLAIGILALQSVNAPFYASEGTVTASQLSFGGQGKSSVRVVYKYDMNGTEYTGEGTIQKQNGTEPNPGTRITVYVNSKNPAISSPQSIPNPWVIPVICGVGMIIAIGMLLDYYTKKRMPNQTAHPTTPRRLSTKPHHD